MSLMTGPLGGESSAALWLAKRRGARVMALTPSSKVDLKSDLGAPCVVIRDEGIVIPVGRESTDLIFDNVAEDEFSITLKLLHRGGRYTSYRAITGPIVDLDVEDMSLKDILLIRITEMGEPVFPNLINPSNRRCRDKAAFAAK